MSRTNTLLSASFASAPSALGAIDSQTTKLPNVGPDLGSTEVTNPSNSLAASRRADWVDMETWHQRTHCRETCARLTHSASLTPTSAFLHSSSAKASDNAHGSFDIAQVDIVDRSCPSSAAEGCVKYQSDHMFMFEKKEKSTHAVP